MKVNNVRQSSGYSALRLGAAASGIAMSVSLCGAALAQEADSAAPQKEDIIVTGTLIRGDVPVGTNVIGISDEDIKEVAATSSNELLASVPQVTNFFNSNPTTDLGITITQVQIARPNIRNLVNVAVASSPTLVLVDGHRIAVSGVNQASVDPDVIPLGAIQRVDVMTEGGSAIYGADAVAGVINFVTRRRFDGIEVDANYGFADDYWETSINGTVGKDWGSGSIYAAYSYSKTDELFGRDRDWIRRLDYSQQPYLPRGRECADPNLTVNYVVQAFNFTAASLSAGAPDFVLGVPNACDASDNLAVIPQVERHGGLIGLTQDLDDTTTVDVRAFYSRRETLSLSEQGGQGLLPADFMVPPTFPPQLIVFGSFIAEPVASAAFSFAPLLGNASGKATTVLEAWGVNMEARKELSADWEVRALINWSGTNSKYSATSENAARLNAATSTGLIDPFNIAAADPAVVADILDNETTGQSGDDLLDLRLIAEGALFQLPGGDVRLAFGGEFMHDDYRLRTGSNIRIGSLSNVPYFSYDRNVWSAFGELQVPIFGSGNATAGFESLVLSLAARYDDYEDFGDTFNPKIGLTWKPVDWLSFRGNWGTSFTAPTPLEQLRSANNVFSFVSFVPFRRPDGEVPPSNSYTVFIQGSQPGLRPQEATTWSIGFDIEPPFIPGFNLTVNYYNVEFTDIISNPTAGSGIFNDFPDNVATSISGFTPAELRAFGMLAPGGDVIVESLISQGVLVYEFVDFRTSNFGILKVEGLDFVAGYRTDTGFGGIDFSLSGNYQLSRKQQVSPTAQVVDNLATEIPKLLFQATAGANIGDFRAQVSFNYTDGYDLDPIPNNTDPATAHLAAFKTVDLYFKYDVPADSGVLEDLVLSLSVDNVFDEAPNPYYGSNVTDSGYHQYGGFSIGRKFRFGVRKKF